MILARPYNEQAPRGYGDRSALYTERAEARTTMSYSKGSRAPIQQRIARLSVDAPNGCRVWTGLHFATGYAQIGHQRKTRSVHRLVWELAHGPIPAGLCVCHHCDNRSCVRLAHLFLATPAGNMHDKVAKGRQARGPEHSAKLRSVMPRGEASASARYTDAQLMKARAMRDAGYSGRAIARAIGMSQTHVRRVLSGAVRPTDA